MKERTSFPTRNDVLASKIDINNPTPYLVSLLQSLHTHCALGAGERRDVFFSLTRLLSSKDPHVKRLIYLCVDKLNIESDDRLIAVNSLVQDCSGKAQPHALRLLARIIDNNTATSIRTVLSNALVSQDPVVQSSALQALLVAHQRAPELISDFFTHVERLLYSSGSLQYAAVCAFIVLKSKDLFAINKHLSSLVTSNYLVNVVRVRAGCNVDRLDNEMVRHDALLMNPKAFVNRLPSILEDLSGSNFCGLRGVLRSICRLNSATTQFDSLLEPLIESTNSEISSLAIRALLSSKFSFSSGFIRSVIRRASSLSSETRLVLTKLLSNNLNEEYENKLRLCSSLFVSSKSVDERRLILNSLSKLATIPKTQKHILGILCDYVDDYDNEECTINSICIITYIACKNREFVDDIILFIFKRLLIDQGSIRIAGLYSLSIIACAYPDLREELRSTISSVKVEPFEVLTKEFCIFVEACGVELKEIEEVSTLKISDEALLSGPHLDYCVYCTKRVYANYVEVAFRINCQLENTISVEVDGKLAKEMSLSEEPSTVRVDIKDPFEKKIVRAVLKTKGESVALDPVVVNLSDFIVPCAYEKELPLCKEETFKLTGMRSTEEAIDEISKVYGLIPSRKKNKIEFVGCFMGKDPVVVAVNCIESRGVVCTIKVYSTREDVGLGMINLVSE